MAHIMQRAYVLPAVSSLWQRHSAQGQVLALTKLATHAQSAGVSVGLTSLRDWHLDQQCRQYRSTSRQRARVCAAATDSAANTKHKVVFLGTPGVAADVLYQLIQASKERRCTFEVAATVTQPAKPRRGSKIVQSPVAQMAQDLIPSRQLFTPESAKDEEFLKALAELQPDLCVTAAYGNYLPKKFLEIPKYGTVNIHPSLLPKYRGAAPVQRAIQYGEKRVGVCLLYTVPQMDAGPIIAQEALDVDDGIQAHELLCHLFSAGTRLLLNNVQAIWSGEAEARATPQSGDATTAPKLNKRDSQLDWSRDAWVLHNQVRAFAPWPGTTHTFFRTGSDDTLEAVRVNILKTEVCTSPDWPGSNQDERVAIGKNAIYVRCGDGNALSILKLQVAGRKPVDPVAFVNGLNGRTLHLHDDHFECDID